MADTAVSEQRPWIPLASSALHFAAFGDWQQAQQRVQALADKHGSDCLPAVMMAWIDTMLARLPSTPDGKRVRLLFAQYETGVIETAADVDPATRWAGRLIAARADDDEPQFRALVNSVASDEEWALNVAAVLNTCGTTIRRIQESLRA